MVKKACDKLNIICIPRASRSLRVRSTAACPATTAASAAAAASRHQTSAPARFCFPRDENGKADADYRRDGPEILVNKEGKAEGVPTLIKRRARKSASSARAIVWPPALANPRVCC